MCGSCAHPVGSGGSLSPQDTAAAPCHTGQPGRPWPLSSQTLARASPSAAGQGSGRSPPCAGSVSGSPCLQGSSFSQLPALRPLSKLSQPETLDAPLRSTRPLLFLPQPTQESPRHLGVTCGPGRVRPAALPGSWPGHAPQPCSGSTDLHTSAMAPRRFPCSTPSVSKRDVTPRGPQDNQGVLRCRTRQRAGDEKDPCEQRGGTQRMLWGSKGDEGMARMLRAGWGCWGRSGGQDEGMLGKLGQILG